MLVISRKKQEVIVINGNIEIKVCEILGNKVRIGISAPKEVPIIRKELIEKRKSSNSDNQ